MAEPAVGSALPGDLHRRHGGQDPRRGGGEPSRLSVGVDLEGRKHVLGIWIGDSQGEGSKFWLAVLSELKNRGVADVLSVVCDGLNGLPDAIEAVWPQVTVQTCVVHLLRGSFRYASYQDRKKLAQSLRPIYTAASIDEAEEAMEAFEAQWGSKMVPHDPVVDREQRGRPNLRAVDFPQPIESASCEMSQQDDVAGGTVSHSLRPPLSAAFSTTKSREAAGLFKAPSAPWT